MVGDFHFLLRVETENPRQKPAGGTETFIYKIKMSAKVSKFSAATSDSQPQSKQGGES